MRFNIGDWEFSIGSDAVVKECTVCESTTLTVDWEGIGPLCIKHSVDWMVDQYDSPFDYAKFDAHQMADYDEEDVLTDVVHDSRVEILGVDNREKEILYYVQEENTDGETSLHKYPKSAFEYGYKLEGDSE